MKNRIKWLVRNNNSGRTGKSCTGSHKKSAASLLMLCLCSCLLAACSSVTVRPYGGEKDTSPPDYQDSKAFYILAIFGDHTVNTSEVCGQRRVMQMQAVTSLSDWLQSLFTLFIYTPRTAKVWCEKQDAVFLSPYALPAPHGGVIGENRQEMLQEEGV